MIETILPETVRTDLATARGPALRRLARCRQGNHISRYSSHRRTDLPSARVPATSAHEKRADVRTVTITVTVAARFRATWCNSDLVKSTTCSQVKLLETAMFGLKIPRLHLGMRVRPSEVDGSGRPVIAVPGVLAHDDPESTRAPTPAERAGVRPPPGPSPGYGRTASPECLFERNCSLLKYRSQGNSARSGVRERPSPLPLPRLRLWSI